MEPLGAPAAYIARLKTLDLTALGSSTNLATSKLFTPISFITFSAQSSSASASSLMILADLASESITPGPKSLSNFGRDSLLIKTLLNSELSLCGSLQISKSTSLHALSITSLDISRNGLT